MGTLRFCTNLRLFRPRLLSLLRRLLLFDQGGGTLDGPPVQEVFAASNFIQGKGFVKSASYGVISLRAGSLRSELWCGRVGRNGAKLCVLNKERCGTTSHEKVFEKARYG